MTKAVELCYLIHIELLCKGITCKSRAISGKDILKLLKKDAPLYAKWIGEKKFLENCLLALSGRFNFCDPENVKYLKKSKENYIDLVCDSKNRPPDPKTYLKAKYFMLNGDKKGWNFECGIDEKQIKRENEGRPLKKIEALSQVRTDDDFGVL